MAKIDSAYDYYVSTYGSQKASRYDSHKKSDLRKISNSIIKSNKESPLYKIANMSEAKRYAIDIKENARSIENAVASLSEQDDNSFLKKVAISSDPDTVSVEYVGDGNEDNKASEFEITVNKLASPQVNEGNFLSTDATSFKPGSYSFDLNTNTAAYEFQFNVNAGETNGQVLDKLEKLVNGSNLKISAELEQKGDRAALKLTSQQTGLHENEPYLFDIKPNASTESIEAMDLLGINQITKPAENSDFLLNGREEHSLNNTFTINNAFELTLNDISSEEEPTVISFKADTDAVADNIQSLLDSFNGMIDTAKKYADRDSDSHASNQGHKLIRDMSSIFASRSEELEAIGLTQDENGRLELNRDLLAEAITPDKTADTLHTLADLRDAIGGKASGISVNPMNYVDKVVVEYKNPGKNFATPYISSIYSGMMLDNKI